MLQEIGQLRLLIGRRNFALHRVEHDRTSVSAKATLRDEQPNARPIDASDVYITRSEGQGGAFFLSCALCLVPRCHGSTQVTFEERAGILRTIRALAIGQGTEGRDSAKCLDNAEEGRLCLLIQTPEKMASLSPAQCTSKIELLCFGSLNDAQSIKYECSGGETERQ